MAENNAKYTEFNKYTREISTAVIEKYGSSYQTQSNLRNAWRNTIVYSAETEDFLILFTKVYIRNLDKGISNNRNPQFLHSLIAEMADYLSKYTSKNYTSAKTNTAKKRKISKSLLMHTLFDDFDYIQDMLATQERNRYERVNNPRYKQEKLRREKYDRAHNGYVITLQVRAEFKEVGKYKKK